MTIAMLMANVLRAAKRAALRGRGDGRGLGA